MSARSLAQCGRVVQAFALDMPRPAALSSSDIIAAHVATMPCEDLPPEAEQAARRALLDALGVMLAATGLSPEAEPFRHLAHDRPPGTCRIFGDTLRSGPAEAAFANGALGHALDFGDCFDAGPAHPHAALVPALIAIADSRNAITLGQLLSAIAIGGDLACRLSLAAARPFEDGGWYPPPLVNLISASAACARLLGLDPERTVAAMGFALLSGSFPAALKYDRRSPLRGTREAFAARAAVDAALLAQAGAAGFCDPLGGAGGFFEVYGGGIREEPLLSKLGERYLGADVSFKPWPACRGTHAYIEAALLLREHASVDDIRLVTAGIGPIQQMLAAPLPPWPEALSATGAKFSIGYTVAVAFIEGTVDLHSFDEVHLQDERIRKLAEKVEAARVAGWGRQQAASGQLSLVLADGSRHEVEIAEALGAPGRPLTDEVLAAKFVKCAEYATPALSAARSSEVAQGILHGSTKMPVTALFDRLGGAQ
ncbi:MAG TPA: MmgE/PrpD family protein, partial [Croceibacterium sp.]|nr:MmgE/PrpD family protein [Croceibacterium sp.]